MMDIYHYHPVTGEFLKPHDSFKNPSKARIEPIKKKPLIPANATNIAVPPVNDNEAAIFNKENQAWDVVPDFRGKKYFRISDQEEIELALGETPGADVTDIAPTVSDEVWVVDHWDILLDKLAERKLSAINVEYNKAAEALLSGYPQIERDTFWKQETEARAFKEDAGAVTPYLDGAAIGRDISKVDLADKIILKVDVFSQAVGELTGKRQRLRDAFLAATKATDLEKINW